LDSIPHKSVSRRIYSISPQPCAVKCELSAADHTKWSHLDWQKRLRASIAVTRLLD
jgi:hypothetical protein